MPDDSLIIDMDGSDSLEKTKYSCFSSEKCTEQKINSQKINNIFLTSESADQTAVFNYLQVMLLMDGHDSLGKTRYCVTS